ncbi:quinone oxidoreductase family protein [Nocardia jiangxiensis]|uniref:quinone oxidoreductase family protein n=1 Tax=Nocardia jiangxiensis TaxID=282685 RepID=UPI0002D5D9B5|nr:zinc-binding dehydrogenase [Nocardia jiangxiensis]
MHAVVIDSFGSPEVLQYREVPAPRPGPGEAAIAVRAVSVNRSLDIGVRAGKGRRAQLPMVLGVDPTGTVDEVGAGVDPGLLGRRVAVRSPLPGRAHLGVDRWGGYADRVVVPAAALADIPAGLDFPEATVIFRHYPTAFHLLDTMADVQPGERVLVMGATGALGSAGIEASRLLGGRVIACVGSESKAEVARSLGAEHTVNYRTQDLRDAVMELTEGAGVNVVFENISDPDLWPKAFASLAREGRLVTAGAHAGPIVPLDVRALYRNRLRILGGAGSDPRSWERTTAAATKGELHPLIAEILPLSQARRAHELVEKGDLIGKVILRPAGQ